MVKKFNFFTLLLIDIICFCLLFTYPVDAAPPHRDLSRTAAKLYVQQTPDQGQIRIARPKVNLRSGPGTNYVVIASATEGQLFSVIGSNADSSWYKIRVDDKPEAWVAASVVDYISPATAETTVPITNTQPLTSTELLYIAQKDDSFEVRGIDAKAGATSILLAQSTSETPRTVAWSPQLTALAFIEPAPWGPPQGTLKVLDLATGQELPLFGNPDYQKLVGDPKSQVDNNAMLDPAWAPDGATLAFADEAYPPTVDAMRYVLKLTDLAGTNYRTLTGDSTTGIQSPAWSPDGKWLAFRADNGLWLVDSLGKQARHLVDIELGEEVQHWLLDISWAPDGKKILFAANLPDANQERFDLYTIKPDGSGLTNLTKSPAMERLPTWSPDGASIAYQYPLRNKYGLYVMKANGRDAIQVAGHEWAWIDYLRWSPDGKRLAFAAQTTTNFDLYVVNANGKGLQHLTTSDEDEFAPVWTAVIGKAKR